MQGPTTIPSEPHTVPAEPIVAAGWEPRGAISANALPPGARVGEFEVLEVLGEGGFGIVYRARDHSLNRTIALKEFMPVVLAGRSDAGWVSVRSGEHVPTFLAGLGSFVNEAKLLAQFDHPSLVKVFRFCEANGTAYMAMPLYEGGTLRQVLRQRRARGATSDEAWLRALLDPLLDALATLHGADCLHRDVSPDNIFLVGGDLPQPRPVLLDLGAARRVIGEQTQALTVILKPGFAPIEQYDEIPGMRQGPWTDLYALAAVLHDAIVGRPPPPSVRRAVLDTYEPLSRAASRLPGRYSPTFLAAIDAALVSVPGGRPRDVAAWRALLSGRMKPAGAATAIVAQKPATAAARHEPLMARRRAPTGGDPVRTRKRRTLPAILLAAAAATVLALVALSGASTDPADTAGTAVNSGPPRALDDKSSDPAQPQAPVPPADSVRSRDGPSVDSAPQGPALDPPSRPGAPASGDASDPGASPRVARENVAPVPVEDEGIVGAPRWVRRALREARQCLVAARYACTIERAEEVLKSDPSQPAALRLARLGREGLAAAAARRR